VKLEVVISSKIAKKNQTRKSSACHTKAFVSESAFAGPTVREQLNQGQSEAAMAYRGLESIIQTCWSKVESLPLIGDSLEHGAVPIMPWEGIDEKGG
jgi:hypothetical protein